MEYTMRVEYLDQGNNGALNEVRV